MDKIEIPDKCEDCGKRRPKLGILERGMDRNFNSHLYIKFICNECANSEENDE